MEKKEEDNGKVMSPKNKEDKELKKVFLVVGGLVAFFLISLFAINLATHSKYDNINFDRIQEGELTFYHTSLPVDSNHIVTADAVAAKYNLYFRNSPAELKEIPFEGDITLMEDVILNFTEEFNCDGDGVIAVANFITVLNVLGADASKNEELGCDEQGRYTFIQFQVGNETGIVQTGPSCYEFNINNCEILEVTEKYMVEVISEVIQNKLS